MARNWITDVVWHALMLLVWITIIMIVYRGVVCPPPPPPPPPVGPPIPCQGSAILDAPARSMLCDSVLCSYMAAHQIATPVRRPQGAMMTLALLALAAWVLHDYWRRWTRLRQQGDVAVTLREMEPQRLRQVLNEVMRGIDIDWCRSILQISDSAVQAASWSLPWLSEACSLQAPAWRSCKPRLSVLKSRNFVRAATA